MCFVHPVPSSAWLCSVHIVGKETTTWVRGTQGEQATGLKQRFAGIDTADPFKVPSPPLFM